MDLKHRVHERKRAREIRAIREGRTTAETPADPFAGMRGDLMKPRVKLIERDGNAFAILGACYRAAKKAGWTEEHWKQVHDEMASGDYDHLLQTAIKHFRVS
jgi:hypothetical protein